MATELHKAQARDKAAGHGPAADLGQRAKVLTAAHTITAAENGTTYYLNSATEFAVTLPKPLLGLRYRFVVVAPPVGADYTIVTNGGADIIKGSIGNVIQTAGVGVTDANADTIHFEASTALAGDWVELESDGTNWYLRGQFNDDGAITLTTT